MAELEQKIWSASITWVRDEIAEQIRDDNREYRRWRIRAKLRANGLKSQRIEYYVRRGVPNDVMLMMRRKIEQAKRDMWRTLSRLAYSGPVYDPSQRLD